MGNIWVLVTCYRNLKRNQFPLMWCVANLASADLLFTCLTPFNAISVMWRWVGGNATCKLQGFLIETSYSSSITTLVVISYLRLKAVTDPFNSRSGRFSSREYMKLVTIWCICLVICLPIAHIYRVEPNEDGKLVCQHNMGEHWKASILHCACNSFLRYSIDIYDCHATKNFSFSSSEHCSNAQLAYHEIKPKTKESY